METRILRQEGWSELAGSSSWPWAVPPSTSNGAELSSCLEALSYLRDLDHSHHRTHSLASPALCGGGMIFSREGTKPNHFSVLPPPPRPWMTPHSLTFPGPRPFNHLQLSLEHRTPTSQQPLAGRRVSDSFRLLKDSGPRILGLGGNSQHLIFLVIVSVLLTLFNWLSPPPAPTVFAC